MNHNISVPMAVTTPRALTVDEREVLTRVADALVPAQEDAPAASSEPGFWEALDLALDARADAFDSIAQVLGELAPVKVDELWGRLRSLSEDEPHAFQALSTVIAGAWLLTPGTRARIGYQGQRSDKAGIEEAADEISSGILDPVLERGRESKWIR